MNIEESLLSFIIELYEKYCHYSLQMTDQEFDQSFYDESGEEISNLAYLKINHDQIYNDEIFETLYELITSDETNLDIPLPRYINFLAGTYFIYHYNDQNDNIIRYLKITPIEEITELFKTNYHFGVDMLKSYFYGLIDDTKVQKNQETITQNDDASYPNRFFQNARLYDVIILNDLLRNIICDLYNHFIQNGCSDHDALNNTWHYFLNDFDPLGTLDKMGIDIASKRIYKRLMLGLIISDLYEDVTDNSIIQSINQKDRIADIIPIISASMGLIAIPNDENIRNRMLKHFILLQDERQKRQKNREKTYQDKRINIIKRINPIYQLDDLTLKKLK